MALDGIAKLIFCPSSKPAQALPVQKTQRTISTVEWEIPIYLQFVKQQLVIFTGNPPFNLKTDKRITRKLLQESKSAIFKPSPLQEAFKYAEMLKKPSVVSMAQIGERFEVSRARVCQMLNLLELDEGIQKYLISIKNPKEHNYFTERRLREVASIKDKNEQKRRFEEILNQMRFEVKGEIY